MKTCLLINENAGTAEQADRLRQAVEGHEEITCWQNSSPEEAVEAVKRALSEGYERIGAAGGDGTAHEVVNGILRHRREGQEVVFGIVPLGTGNDLARTLAIPDDPRDAVAMLVSRAPQPLDLMQVEGRIDGEQRMVYGINAAAGGFSGQVDKEMTSELKGRWGPLAYLLGAATAAPNLHEYDTRIAFDDAPDESIDALNIVVANGRTIGGGRLVAPAANPCDGLLDVVIIKWGTMVNFAQIGADLMAGRLLESPHVVHRRVEQVQVFSNPGMWFNVDGELQTKEPLTFTVAPAALPVVTGPDFRPDPTRPAR